MLLNFYTYFNWKSGWQLHVNEVLEFLEVSVGDGEEVHDGHHLLLQGQRVLLTQPQLRAELLPLLTLLPRPQARPRRAQVTGEGLRAGAGSLRGRGSGGDGILGRVLLLGVRLRRAEE